MMKQTIHVFDVDGTILYGDSLLRLWLFMQTGFWKMVGQMVSVLPFLLMGNNQKAKEKMLSNLFLGKPQEEIERVCQLFFDRVLKYKLRPRATEDIIALNEKEIPVVLLSASCDPWLKPLARYLSADLICTQFAYDDQQHFTGLFATPNCKGPEKLKRLLGQYPANTYEFVCYGNTKSDKKLEAISKAFYYRYF